MEVEFVLDNEMSDMPEFLTVEEAAALLRIGRTSAYALAREWRATGGRKGLPVVELGRQLRVPKAALEDLHTAPAGQSGKERNAPPIEQDGREDETRRHGPRKGT